MMSLKVLLINCTDMMILKNLRLPFLMILHNLMMMFKKLMSIMMMLDGVHDHNEF